MVCQVLAGTQGIVGIAVQAYQGILDQAFQAIQGIAVPKVPQGLVVGQVNLEHQDGQVSQVLVVLADQAFQGTQGILDQVHQDIVAILGRKGLQDIVAILAKLVHQAHLAGLDIAVQAYQDIQALAGLVHLVGQVSVAGQDLAVSVDGLAKWVHQAHLAGQDSAVQLVNLVLVAGQVLAVSVVLVDQVYQGIQDLVGILANKVQVSISKAQWPHQPICQPQGIMSMMHTLFHPMEICMFGVAQFGTMLAK